VNRVTYVHTDARGNRRIAHGNDFSELVMGLFKVLFVLVVLALILALFTVLFLGYFFGTWFDWLFGHRTQSGQACMRAIRGSWQLLVGKLQ
jgi:hypothetical protein